MVRQTILELDQQDRDILDQLAVATGTSRAEVLRWALRFYALTGPWCATRRERLEQVGHLPPLSVGPNLWGIK